MLLAVARVALGLFALAPAAGAAEATSPDEGAASAAAPPDSVARPPVRVVLIGEELAPATLRDALGAEVRATFALAIVRAARFDAQELFRARFDVDTEIHVWIDATEPTLTRLYFASRAGTRFLVRQVELSGAMDELDRETLAQVLTWALRALAAGSAPTLTRDQAAALVGASPPPTAAATAASPTAVDATAPQTAAAGWPPWRPNPRSPWFVAASFYRLTLHSAEIPVMHGPGARAGLDFRVGHALVGLHAGAALELPQRYEDRRVALELTTVAWRFDVRALAVAPHPGVAGGVRLGTGFDSTWLDPAAIDAGRFTALARSTEVTPSLGGGLVGQARLASRARLEVDLGLDVDLEQIHYDVVTATSREPLVDRWRLHPTLGLGVEIP